MYITNLDEAVAHLRGRLRDYLTQRLGLRSNARKLNCFFHQEENPSMSFNPKLNDEVVKCFSCGESADIFKAASQLDNLPSSGIAWVTETVPALCEMLNVQLRLGEPTPTDKEKAKLYKLAQDITDILALNTNEIHQYVQQRNWEQDRLVVASLSEETLISKLVEIGWNASDINRSNLVRTNHFSYFGEDKITFVIRDTRARPIAFISRDLNDASKSKYVNSLESLIYDKSKVLLGLDVAAKHAKQEGVYIVEGPGDLAQLYRLGILNAVAVCGTAFTEHHLLALKAAGIRTLYFNFDWDQAGYLATQRVLEHVLKATNGISTYVILPTSDTSIKDPDDLLKSSTDPNDYLSLKRVTGFEWQLAQFSDNDAPDVIAEKMTPVIATEPLAVKRETLIRALSEFTGLSMQAIASDVNSLRDNKYNERKDKIIVASESYVQQINEDPENVLTILAQHEQQLEKIERDYNRDNVGVNYQVSRLAAIQEHRSQFDDDPGSTGFRLNYFSNFADALSDGMNWSSGCLIYAGGRQNSGKTATVIALGCDVAHSDDDAIVILHSTDDNYEQIEPRLVTSIWNLSGNTETQLSIGTVCRPNTLDRLGSEYKSAYRIATDTFRELVADERLVILDAEDGTTLTALERNVRYYRNKYPSKKILVIADNTHNYSSYAHLEQTQRMTNISNDQKHMCAKYHMTMLATVEYRKNMPMDISKLKLPVDDDLADSRALMYRPNLIFHVYNDLNDRRDYADIFWRHPNGKIMPRLLLHFGKNKISSFKDKLVMDLNVDSVTLRPKLTEEAREETVVYSNAKTNGKVQINNGSYVEVDADEYEEDYE